MDYFIMTMINLFSFSLLVYIIIKAYQKVEFIKYLKQNGEIVEVRLENVSYRATKRSRKASFDMYYKYKGKERFKKIENLYDIEAYNLARKSLAGEETLVTIDKYNENNIFYDNVNECSTASTMMVLILVSILMLIALAFIFLKG